MDCLLVIPLSDGPCRHAAHDGIGLHISSDHCPGADDGAVPDVNAGEDDGFIADPDVVPDHDVPPVVPGRRDLGNRRPPRLIEDGKRIGGERPQRVVRTVQQELSPAGNGTVLSDHQSVAVDGVVVENIVPLKLHWVPYEVVVDRIVPHGDVVAMDHRPQIDGLPVPGPGINCFSRNSHDLFPPVF